MDTQFLLHLYFLRIPKLRHLLLLQPYRPLRISTQTFPVLRYIPQNVQLNHQMNESLQDLGHLHASAKLLKGLEGYLNDLDTSQSYHYAG